MSLTHITHYLLCVVFATEQYLAGFPRLLDGAYAPCRPQTQRLSLTSRGLSETMDDMRPNVLLEEKNIESSSESLAFGGTCVPCRQVCDYYLPP